MCTTGRSLIRWAALLALFALFTGCADSRDAAASGCDEIPTAEAHVSLRVSAPAPPKPRACQANEQCEGLGDSRRPACTARYNNVCVCESALASDGSCPRGKGTCVWHPDPSTDHCICVPGSIEVGPCTAGKVRKCANSGTSWGSCS